MDLCDDYWKFWQEAIEFKKKVFVLYTSSLCLFIVINRDETVTIVDGLYLNFFFTDITLPLFQMGLNLILFQIVMM